tara:strand:- start:284 stop:937 length:654 start_codon:yes stop_codon:yes gene_type:complete
LKKNLFNFFVAFSVTIFCALGTWQLYRLQWKQDLINQINIGLKSKPVPFSKNVKNNYQRVITNGDFDFKKQIYLYSLNDQGQPGFDVITPLKTKLGVHILVNRGWILKELKGAKEINRFDLKNISGILKKINKANIFKPKNDLNNNVWFSINLEDVTTFSGQDFSNYVLYLDNKDISTPTPRKITADLPNNHLKYAITWYSISISILFYYLYFRKKK